MNALTGGALSDDEHIRQSVVDILTTPLGSRVMLLNYGSDLPNLVDRPMNELFVVDAHAATAVALETWEPRIKFSNAVISRDQDTGRAAIDVIGTRTADGSPIRLEGIKL